jgi:16S rRNA (cytosine1402-N4)-methyltransferase
MAVSRMSNIIHQHIPVLLQEAVAGLVTAPGGIYIDATFGRGSHSREILSRLNADGRLIAFDKDPEAIAAAKSTIQDERFSIYHASFAGLKMVLQNINAWGSVTGILFDLGVSSPQLDDPERGFSFVREGKLDMRMDTSRGKNAMEWLEDIDETELANVLWLYGEEKFSRRIARAIVTARAEQPITTTAALADIITRAIPYKFKKPQDKHAATRSFQAIRIAVNQELEDLEKTLPQALEALAVGGRLVAISFHSLEDRIVKQFIRQHEKGEELPHGLPVKGSHFNARLKALGKPVKASETELNLNPRARSAIMRIAEKQS